MILVDYYRSEHRARIRGHAGLEMRGQDPVCAGISVLSFTLIEAAEEYNLHLYVNDGDAEMDIRCYPDEDKEERCRYLFDTILHGMEMLAEIYPENVRVGGDYDG